MDYEVSRLYDIPETYVIEDHLLEYNRTMSDQDTSGYDAKVQRGSTKASLSNEDFGMMQILGLGLVAIVIGLCLWKWRVLYFVLTWPFHLVTGMMSYSVTATATSGGLLGTIAAKLGFVAAPVVTLATVRVGATAVVVGLLANGFYFTAVGTMFYGLRRLVLG